MATSMLVLSAAAQEGGGGQEIIFSKPANGDTSAATPSLTPQNHSSPTLPSDLTAPMSAFPDQPSDLLLPPPRNPVDRGRSNKIQDDRRNWMMMTPAEIFGVTPTEQMLKPAERDAFGREKKPSQLERFLDRENQNRTEATNNWRSERAPLPWSLSGDQSDDSPLARWSSSTSDKSKNLNRLMEGQSIQNSAGKQNVNFDRSGFDPIGQQKLTQAKLEQLATLDRFREMLKPSSDPAPSPDSRFFPVPKPEIDPYMTQPDFVPNPAGASFKPLHSNVGKPVGLTPLPGIVTPREQPTVIPSWKPQPPPWISGSPTAFPQQHY